MTPRLSGHFSMLGLVFFVLRSLSGIARQWSLEKFAINNNNKYFICTAKNRSAEYKPMCGYKIFQD